MKDDDLVAVNFIAENGLVARDQITGDVDLPVERGTVRRAGVGQCFFVGIGFRHGDRWIVTENPMPERYKF
jgi:hypothetical protein